MAVLVGTNRDEFGQSSMNMTTAEVAEALDVMYGPTLGPAVLAEYPPSAFPTPGGAFSRALSDSMLTCPARDTARWLTAPARAGGGVPDTYLYLYMHASVLWNLLMPGSGAMHMTDILNTWELEPFLVGPGEPEVGAQRWAAGAGRCGLG